MIVVQPTRYLKSNLLSTQSFTLEKNTVDVWLFRNHELPINVNNYVSLSELNRANQFYVLKDKNLFLYQHAWMNKILGLYVTKNESQTFEYTLNPYGKPYLRGIEFNLSHSGQWTILAVGCDNPVGIDIEKFTSLDYLGIASELFSQNEMNEIKKLKANKLAYAFFQIWAQKEAFIKAIGMGLSYPTSLFDVDWQSKTFYKVKDPKTGINWLITRFLIEIGYASAICHCENVNKINFFKLI